MKLSLTWIRDYVDIDPSLIKDLPHMLTMSTAEVEGVEVRGEDVEGVVVGEITRIDPLPGSDKLTVISVNIGAETVESICGAPNIYVGMRLPFARVGGRLPEFGEVESIEFKGVKSNGIACSLRDLGIIDMHEGVLEITEDCSPGDDARKLLGISDLIIEIDNKSLTHRPDLWGHYGFAREVAALTGVPLKPLSRAPREDLVKPDKVVTAEIYDNEKCLRYTAVGIDGIRIGPSPAWMQTRLSYVGQRPINSIVDLTNYVMLEIGQPMHAFDSALMGSRINIMTMGELLHRTGRNDSTFITLDGIERKIPEETLMICSENRPVAMGGIMGGENSEVSESTTRIILESATFDAVSVRKSSIATGLRTEASMRFEKSLDTSYALTATERFYYLLKTILPDASIYSGLDDKHPRPTEPVKIAISADHISSYVGQEIKPEEVERILSSLGFVTTRTSTAARVAWEVTVPTFRATKDVTIPADLVEEVARIYGYDNITPKPIEAAIVPTPVNRDVAMEHRIKEVLANRFAMNEIHTYVWYDKDWVKTIGHADDDNFRILNPNITKFDTLRRELVPNLLKVAVENEGTRDEFRLFEIGSVYHRCREGRELSGPEADRLRNEERHLGVVVHWKGRGTTQEDEAIDLLKQAADDVLQAVRNISPEFKRLGESRLSYLHPAKRALVAAGGRPWGYISLINPKLLGEFEQKANLAVMELNLEVIKGLPAAEVRYEEPPRYPEVDLDFSILVPKAVGYDEFEKTLRKFAHKYLRSISYVGTYTGKGIAKDKKSVTISMVISSDEGTLSSEEIDRFRKEFIGWLEKQSFSLR